MINFILKNRSVFLPFSFTGWAKQLLECCGAFSKVQISSKDYNIPINLNQKYRFFSIGKFQVQQTSGLLHSVLTPGKQHLQISFTYLMGCRG